jgi:tetratricopeptide (TPR) repeat protein
MSIVFFLSFCCVAGCDADQKTKSQLSTGYTALEARQYDAALAAADAQLARAPKGPGSAEALYLRGRALEQRVATSPHDARVGLQSARNAYAEALEHDPAPILEGYIRASLANVQYFQDDYASALREWSAAYRAIEDPSVKSWVLYRMGLCEQRLGQFEQADRTFAQVQKDFPNTVPAQRAREHQGARGFTVQLATFANATTAQQSIDALRRDGVVANASHDPHGRSVVRDGPMSSFYHDKTLKKSYADRYHYALILP